MHHKNILINHKKQYMDKSVGNERGATSSAPKTILS